VSTRRDLPNSAVSAVGDGRYRLEERLATGGMGEVWQGTDTVLGRQVAIKLPRHEQAEDPTFRARFLAEAKHTAKLSHPGIAQVYDFGELPDSTPYVVMELVAGEPLSAMLRRRRALPPAMAADLVAQAADAVDVAHKAGIIHRDLKPGNLLVTPEGRVKVTDFGIARAMAAAPLTRTGDVIGTPHYLAPEQAEGRLATPASDVYALGVVLYECLTGQLPFDGDSPVAIVVAHVSQRVPPLPGTVPAWLHATCAAALSKDPAGRPSAADMGRALREAKTVGTCPASATRPSSAPTSPTFARTAVFSTGVMPTRTLAVPQVGWRRRPPRWAWAVAAFVIAAILMAAFVAGLVDRVTPDEPTPGTTDAPTQGPRSGATGSAPSQPVPRTQGPTSGKPDKGPKHHGHKGHDKGKGQHNGHGPD
jgi:eukaryotic-like serine/threonine-protein kinase